MLRRPAERNRHITSLSKLRIEGNETTMSEETPSMVVCGRRPGRHRPPQISPEAGVGGCIRCSSPFPFSGLFGGCDASVLLVPTDANNATEKTYPPNLTLRGFNVIDAIKEQLEQACPGTVSCADIIQLSGRDAVQLVYGPSWPVLTGRRDGTVSHASDAAEFLPSAYGNITSLKEKFAAVGLSVKDLAVLSSAHTIGVSHCDSFAQRLYNYSGNGDMDPSLDPNYAAWLMQQCPQNYSTQTVVNQDPITPYKFDYKYFAAVAQNKGLFESDAALLNDDETNSYLQSQVSTQGFTWIQDFAQSMANMYQIGVLTGSDGEIRQKCGYVN